MLDEDCAGAAFCTALPVPGGTCGMCAARVAIGMPCGDVRECDTTGLSGYAACAATTSDSSPHCIGVARTSNVALGGRCGLLKDAEAWTEAACADGLYCRGANTPSTTEGLCATPVSVGQTCEPSIDICADDAMCITNAGGSGTSCQTVTIQTEVGQPCTGNLSGTQVCDSYDRLACVDNSCALVGTGGIGQKCRDERDCDVGLYCTNAALDSTTGLYLGVCAEKRPNGAGCDPRQPTSCQSEYCDGYASPPVCAAPTCR